MSYYTEDEDRNDIAVQERSDGLYVFKNRGLEFTIPWVDVREMYNLAHTIRDINDLGKLPVGTVLRDKSGDIWESNYTNYQWFTPGSVTTWYVEDIQLPATIIYTPLDSDREQD